jgi:hypothetical protein
VTEEFPDLKAVSDYDFRDMGKQMMNMELAFKKHERYYEKCSTELTEVITEFLQEASNKIPQLKLIFEELDNTWLDTAKYFGEDLSDYGSVTPKQGKMVDGKRQVHEFFVDLRLFFEAFHDSTLKIAKENK